MRTYSVCIDVFSPHPAKAPATDVEVTSFHLDNTTLPTTTSGKKKNFKNSTCF